MVDVVIVGAGVAGLSAALTLGRARRQILVLDSGSPRHAPSPASYGFFTRDGTPPAELLLIAREQLRAYPSIELVSDTAIAARRVENRFEVGLPNNARVLGRKLLLAYGVVDQLPNIEGLKELWGRSVLHCAYCHGWEIRDEPLALYARGDEGMELVRLLSGWTSDLALCTDGPAELAPDQCDQLARHSVVLREDPIRRLESRDGGLDRIVFANGPDLPRRAVFLLPRQLPRSNLAVQLGCGHTPFGLVQADERGATSVSGIYAAGDITSTVQQVARAAASGAIAAIAINDSLLAEDFA